MFDRADALDCRRRPAAARPRSIRRRPRRRPAPARARGCSSGPAGTRTRTPLPGAASASRSTTSKRDRDRPSSAAAAGAGGGGTSATGVATSGCAACRGSSPSYSNTPPSRTRWAARTSAVGSSTTSGLAAIASTHWRITRCAPAARSIKSSLAGRSCASHRLKHCSTPHAPSPIVLKPTMRLEPFSVWKARRTVVMVAWSSLRCRSTSICSVMLSSTSPASSTKISHSSLLAAASEDGSGAVGGGGSGAFGGASSC